MTKTRQRLVLVGALCAFFISATVPASSHACTTNLSRGSEGAPVNCLQQMLTITGDYTYGEITGFFGPATELAVQAFQARNGIAAYGTPATTGYGNAGPATRRAILVEAITKLLTLLNVNSDTLTTNNAAAGSSSGGSSSGGGSNSGSSNDDNEDDNDSGGGSGGGDSTPEEPGESETPVAPDEPDPSPGELTMRLLPETDELVWEGGVGNCIMSDGPFNMWKDEDGRAIAIVSVPDNYILKSDTTDGTFLIDENKTPQKVYESPQQKLQSYYNSKMWMMGFWTDDGDDVYAIAHHEWYPDSVYRTYDPDNNLCSSDSVLPDDVKTTDSWVNAIHHLTSTNGGDSFETTVPVEEGASSNSGRLVIVPQPYGDKPVSPDGVTRYGYFHPSNIVQEGSYYYFMVGVQEIIEDENGNELTEERKGFMLMRTSDISEPRSGSTYQFWDGDRWVGIINALPIGRPFIFTHESGLDNAEVIEGAEASVFPMTSSLKWNEEHGEWIILGYARTRELSYITTPSLSNPDMSALKVIEGSLFTGPQPSNTWFASYPTLIDPTSGGYVFQEVNDEPYLYYMDGKGNGERDVRRMKVRIE